MTSAELWKEWQEKSSPAACERWNALEKATEPVCKGPQWLERIRKRINALAMLKILQPRESHRVKELSFDQVAKADQKRLSQQYASPKRTIYTIGVSKHDHSKVSNDIVKADDAATSAERTLQLNSATRLHEGRLSLQVFVDQALERPIGMNVQLSGFDPMRKRPWYLRYDLDSVQMGANPVAHFRAHWHVGDQPDADDAEIHDPRVPSLILDPVAVIDTLIETIFPNGPKDLIDP